MVGILPRPLGNGAIVLPTFWGRAVPASYLFGEFELDCVRYQLRRDRRVLKLERIPMDLLILLAEKQGAVVTRQEIVDRLWGRDVFVDTEHGINTAIRKIRAALREDASHPRFVMTVQGKGYRLAVERNGNSHAGVADSEIPVQPPAAHDPQQTAQAQPAHSPTAPPSVPGQPAKPARSKVDGAVWGSPVRRSASRSIQLAFAILLFGAVALVYAFRTRIFPATTAPHIQSIAVLPLANLSGDKSQDYFADGMTDELITALAKNRNLRVVSRTSAMQYKGVNRSVRDIARELGVDGILEGSVQRSADRVHMTVQLIYAPTDAHVWAESYDRDLKQAYSLPEDLSATIAKEVRVATSPAPPPRFISPEAHDAYMHGRYLWITVNIPETMAYFEKAIQLQPDYAAAWSGLSDTYEIAAMTDNMRPLDVRAKAEEAARKALALDDSVPEAHNAMAAWYLFFAWDPVRADTEARQAIQLNPNYGEAHYVRHFILMALNRNSEAEAEIKRSVELDPFFRSWGLGAFYIATHQFDAAIRELRLRSQAHPFDDFALGYLSNAYRLKGMYPESQQAFEKSLELEHKSADLAAAHQAWVQGGEKAVERWRLESAKARSHTEIVQAIRIALAAALDGDKNETLNYLEAAYRERDADVVLIQNEPLYDFVHAEPRYRALVRRIGLTPAW
jgi:TolB-like protein/DNA-binding winged helix-turn-helix (wHTH) protein